MESPPEGNGERDPWREHEREQLRASLRATPAQRLAWLEEMLVVASLHRRLAPQDREAGGVPRRKDDPATATPGR